MNAQPQRRLDGGSVSAQLGGGMFLLSEQVISPRLIGCGSANRFFRRLTVALSLLLFFTFRFEQPVV